MLYYGRAICSHLDYEHDVYYIAAVHPTQRMVTCTLFPRKQ